MPIIIHASVAPKINGDISTRVEITTARIPTPIRNALAAPECLPEKPSTILAIPLNKNAIARNTTIVIAAATGKDIAIAPNMMTSIPNPTVGHLDHLGEKIPMMICSIPTMNSTIANTQTTEI